MKFDGYRVLAFKDGPEVRLITRNGLDWTRACRPWRARSPRCRADGCCWMASWWRCATAGLSFSRPAGGAVAGKRTGRSSFYAFDLLHLDGCDLRPRPLSERGGAGSGLGGRTGGPLRFSDHLPATRRGCGARPARWGWRASSANGGCRLSPGTRAADWLKVKCQDREEFVVLGWTPPAGSRHRAGRLQLGFHDRRGTLHYVGGVRHRVQRGRAAPADRGLEPLPRRRPPACWVRATPRQGDPGCGRSWWPRSQLAGWSGGGRCATRAISACARTSRRPRWCARCRDPDAARRARPPRQGRGAAQAPTRSSSRGQAEARRRGGRRPRSATRTACSGPAEGKLPPSPSRPGPILGAVGATPRRASRPAAGAGALPGRRRRPAVLPEARDAGHAGRSARGRGRRRALSSASTSRRAGRRGADGRDRAAQLGVQRSRPGARRTGWCSTSIPATA